jgi:hypothetical protein
MGETTSTAEMSGAIQEITTENGKNLKKKNIIH